MDKDNYTARKQRLTASHAGKIPPQAVDLEEIVLGALLLEREAMMDIADILNPETFYHEAHKVIFRAIQKLFIANEPVDIMTVTANLRNSGELEMVGGAYYITNLTSRVASSANIESHARIIQQCYIKRELIRTSSVMIQECYEDTADVFDLLSRADFEKNNLTQIITRKKEETNAELFKKTLTVMQTKREHRGLTGVPSGFKDIDAITGGWQASDLIITAGRPSMGKTAFALQCAINAAEAGFPVAIFSLEMSSIQLMYRQISSVCDIPLEKFRKNELQEWDWQKIANEVAKIEQLPIHWDDTPGLSLIEFRAKARRLKMQYDIQFIVIDYLQLMTVLAEKGMNREQQIGTISRTLKIVAKELNIPIMPLSQLSRALESRPGNGKRPMLSDLRESGSIEQDADMVLFLYRPEYYGITEDESGNSLEGVAEIIIAKHRNGETDSVPLQFRGITTSFSDLPGSYVEATHLPEATPPEEKTYTLKPSVNFYEPDENDTPPF